MMEQKKKRTMPLWIGILSVILATSALTALVLGASQNFYVQLPLFGDIMTKAPDINIESMSFTYNLTTQRFVDAQVKIVNPLGDPHTARIDIWFYDSTSYEIASGYLDSISITGTAKQVTVILTWAGSYTIANFTQGKYQLQQLT